MISVSAACVARVSGLLVALVVTLGAIPAQADQLVFGSFKAADNASNWARKLSQLFAREIEVSPVTRDGTTLYRVHSRALDSAQMEQLRRRATAAGIEHWRLLQTDSAPVEAVAAEPTPPAAPRTPPRNEPQLGAPRLTPPSPVTETAATGAVDDPPAASGGTRQSEWDLGLQTRTFAEEGVFGQDRFEGSISLEFEYFHGWDDDRQSVTATPFVRLDSADSERTHGDLRELFYSRVGDNWDLHVGARRVFWGVTEFQHRVDIINQTDLVENIDMEDKLGQPMAQLTLVRDWGILDVYALLGHRERTFPGTDGRVRLPWRILDDDATYASGAEETRVDGAIRWSHHMGPFEVGLHHFSGTSREPLLVPELVGGEVVLRPHYPVIDQTGIDAQAFYGDWVFKLEGYTRSGFGDRHVAFNVGFERTLVGVFGTRADFGIVGEYLYDERDEEAVDTLFEHDIALGGRLHLNDFADTQALLGVIFDTEYDEYFVSLEASRRLTDTWQLALEGRVFAGGKELRTTTPFGTLVQPEYKSAWLQADDYLQLELKKFL